MNKNVEQTKKRNHLAFYISFPIASLLFLAIILFYFDLSNGPIVFFIFSLIFLAAFIAMNILFLNRVMWQRLIIWGAFLFLTIGCMALSQPTYERKSAAYYSKPVAIQEVLTTTGGKVKGIYNKDQDVEIYAGIPYAKAERWKLPKPYSWEGEIDGKYFGPCFMQAKPNPFTDGLATIYAEKGWHPDYRMQPYQKRSEDGLYLNIWKPKTTEKNLPILVYIHGGSLTSGTSASDDINGESLAKHGVIMITIQYRLGIFGYYANEELMKESLTEEGRATTGNYGLFDQIEALKWVNNNAANIGGDVNNITIAGESAGSSSVSALCASPLAHGLFRRAIGESSSLAVKKAPHTFRSMEDAYKAGKETLKQFKCSSVQELRKLSAEKLLGAKQAYSGMTVDGWALEEEPYLTYQKGNQNEEALLNGYNIKEADAFVIPDYLFSPTNKKNIKERLNTKFKNGYGDRIHDLYKDKIEKDAFSEFNEIMSVYWFIGPRHSWSNLELASGKPVYRYQFTKENGYHGTFHSGELIYAYGNLNKSHQKFAYNQSDYELSDIMVNYWANFAKTGNPNGAGLPEWKPYSESGYIQELGQERKQIEDKYLALYPLLDEYMGTL